MRVPEEPENSPNSRNSGDPGIAAALKPSRAPIGFGDPRPALPSRNLRAEPPRAPALPVRLQAAERERAENLKGRERLERRSMLRGLLLLALLVLVVSLLLADAGRAFPSGWWRRW